MENIKFNRETIKEFGEKTKNKNAKLVEILEKMKNDSVLYQDMVDNKAGNLYKEVMLRELDKEIKRVNDNNESVADKIIFAAEKYLEFEEEVGEKVNGGDRK